jgi:hypothetical protein
VDFDEEDMLEFDPSGPTWSLAYDGSALHTEWSGGPDLDAVALPEPGGLLLLASGITGLLVTGRRRMQR